MVTGASGFLGRATVRACATAGYSTTALVAAGAAVPPELGVANVVEWDASDVGGAAAIFDGALAVVHCAGHNGRFSGSASSDVLYEGNARLVWQVLSSVSLCAAKPKVVVVSSAAVYACDAPPPVAESAELAPRSHYAVSKMLGETIASAYARLEGLKVTIARPFNILGPGEPAGSVVHDILIQLNEQSDSRNAVVNLRESQSVRDFVDVDDVANALILLCGQPTDGIYNVCSGAGTSVRELVEAIGQVAKTDIDLRVAGTTEATVSIGDPGRLRALGWLPRYTLRESIERLLAQG